MFPPGAWSCRPLCRRRGKVRQRLEQALLSSFHHNLAEVVGHGWVMGIQLLQGVTHQFADQQVAIPFSIRRDDVPRCVLRVASD